MLRNILAYFSQNPQIRNCCINWWVLCSLAVHYFPRVFLSVYFCFACHIYAHAQFFGKIKTNGSRLLNYRFLFNKQCSCTTHPQCCLTFSWIELQMLLSCCLMHVGIIYNETQSLGLYAMSKSSRLEVFLEISQNSQENTCVRVSFLITLQASSLELY